MERVNSKPRLFFFGDSFIQWHLPNPGHWTERFSDEYEVYRLGSSGASNESILGQFGVLPEFQEGDRIVVCLTEPSRISKWLHCNQYAGWIQYREKLISGEPIEDCFVESIYKVRLHKDLLLHNKLQSPYNLYVDNPIQTLNTLGLMFRLLVDYKPVYISWDKNLTKVKPLQQIINIIELGTFTTVAEEDPTKESHDYHPGVEGGKVWYNKVKDLLDNWNNCSYTPMGIGTNYFDPDIDYLQNINKIPHLTPHLNVSQS